MKYYRRHYTWLGIDIESRTIRSFVDSPESISVTKHVAPPNTQSFDNFAATIDNDVIEVEDYDQYILENPQSLKCIVVTEEEFNQKKQQILSNL